MRETDLHQHHGAERRPATRARLVQRQAGLSHHPRMRVDRPHHGGTQYLARDCLWHEQLMNPSQNNVAFRSAKERPFVERKATNGGVILGQVLTTRISPRSLRDCLWNTLTRKETIGHCVAGMCRGTDVSGIVVRPLISSVAVTGMAPGQISIRHSHQNFRLYD